MWAKGRNAGGKPRAGRGQATSSGPLQVSGLSALGFTELGGGLED